jgi:DNA (cytosine-5)-methyltransferase 1
MTSLSCDQKPYKPTVISIFAGCGGSTLGYKWAGYNERLAVEWDNHAVNVFRLNFPDIPVYNADVAKLSLDRIYELSGLKPGELDVLDGSPPCQGFSTAGKRRFNDNRNQLFHEYCRLLQELQPKCFIMENVSGMIKGKMKLIFVDILKALKDCGYTVKVKLLNASYYGVPQMRRRLIFLGCKDEEPTYPKPGMRMVLKGALDNIPDHGPEANPFTATRLAWIKKIPAGKNGDYVKKNYGFNWCRLSWDKPANTIPKFRCILHPDEHRWLTIGEVKRVMSFPDDFKLIGPFGAQWQLLGNAVPPKMMQAIATHIKDYLL